MSALPRQLREVVKHILQPPPTKNAVTPIDCRSIRSIYTTDRLNRLPIELSLTKLKKFCHRTTHPELLDNRTLSPRTFIIQPDRYFEHHLRKYAGRLDRQPVHQQRMSAVHLLFVPHRQLKPSTKLLSMARLTHFILLMDYQGAHYTRYFQQIE